MWAFWAILFFVQVDFVYLFWLYFTHIWQLINYVLTFYRFHFSELTFLFVTQTPCALICSWGVNLWILYPLRLRNLLKYSPIKPPATHTSYCDLVCKIGYLLHNKSLSKLELTLQQCLVFRGRSNLWKASDYDVHQIWPSWKPVSSYIL